MVKASASFPVGAAAASVPEDGAHMAVPSGELLLGPWEGITNAALGKSAAAAARPSAMLAARSKADSLPHLLTVLHGEWRAYALTTGIPQRPRTMQRLGMVLVHASVPREAVRARMRDLADDVWLATAQTEVAEAAGVCVAKGGGFPPAAVHQELKGDAAGQALQTFFTTTAHIAADRDAFATAVLPVLRRVAAFGRLRDLPHLDSAYATLGSDGTALACVLRTRMSLESYHWMLWRAADTAEDAFDMAVWTRRGVPREAAERNAQLCLGGVPLACSPDTYTPPAAYVPPPSAGLRAVDCGTGAASFHVTSGHVRFGAWSEVAVPGDTFRQRAVSGVWRMWSVFAADEVDKASAMPYGAVLAHESIPLSGVLARCREAKRHTPAVAGVTFTHVSPPGRDKRTDEASKLAWVSALGEKDEEEATAHALTHLRDYFGWNGRAMVCDDAAYEMAVEPVLSMVANTGAWTSDVVEFGARQGARAPQPMAALGDNGQSERASAWVLAPEWDSALLVSAEAHDGALEMLAFTSRATLLDGAIAGQPIQGDSHGAAAWDVDVLGRDVFEDRVLGALKDEDTRAAVLGIEAVTHDCAVMARALAQWLGLQRYQFAAWRETAWPVVEAIVAAVPDVEAVLAFQQPGGRTPLHDATCGPLLTALIEHVGAARVPMEVRWDASAHPRASGFGRVPSAPWTADAAAAARAAGVPLGVTPLQYAVEEKRAPELVEAWVAAGARVEADMAVGVAYALGGGGSNVFGGPPPATRLVCGNVLDVALRRVVVGRDEELAYHTRVLAMLAASGAQPRVLGVAPEDAVLSADAVGLVHGSPDPLVVRAAVAACWAKAAE